MRQRGDRVRRGGEKDRQKEGVRGRQTESETERGGGGQTRLLQLTHSLLVFIVVERLYGRIFLFMCVQPKRETARPRISLLLSASSCTDAAPHTCVRVAGAGMREDKESLPAALKFRR